MGRVASEDGVPELRVGDRERKAVDDRLRAAHDDGVLTLTEYDERSQACWAARVQRELDVLVADLPAAPAEAPTVVAPPDPPARREERPPFLDRLGKSVVGLAFLGVVAYGAVSVLGASGGTSVFGSRTVVVPDTDREVSVGTLFGSTTVVVPDGVTVRTSGLTIFGSVKCEQACQIPTGGASLPTLDVTANGAFGSVNVETRAEAAGGGIDQRDRDRNDNDDDN